MKMAICIQNQRGVVLVFGMLIMAVLSILGISTMQSSMLQQRMASNLEQRDIAFQRAEAGLRDAEDWLQNPVLPDTNWLYSVPDSGRWKYPATWWESNASANAPTYQSTRYYIEYMMALDISGDDSLKLSPGEEDTHGVYRITSRGVSPNGRSVVILQSTFIR